MAELDFDLEIRTGGDVHEVVARSPAGEAREPFRLPFEGVDLELRLMRLEKALLASGGRRRRVRSAEEDAAQEFGQSLFDALMVGQVRSQYDVSRARAVHDGVPLRIRLRFDSPRLAALPWEFVFDSRHGDYLALSELTPIIRYIERPHSIEPLSVRGRLRILGMNASPTDQDALDVDRERRRFEVAVRALVEDDRLDLQWVSSGSWRDLQKALRQGPWHVFHFIGHGYFDKVTDEGVIAFVDDDGRTEPLSARSVARLLEGHTDLRLVVLNACEGAEGSVHDLFSSTAGSLVQLGTPAVVAMQFEITDDAAIELTRTFYEALVDGRGVDVALGAARKAVSMAIPNTLEWGTPVLFMRSSQGVIFRRPKQRPRAPRPTPQAEPSPTTPAGPDPRAPKPVLVFVDEPEQGCWVLRNVGSGPALNIVVAQRQDGEWFNPVKVPPLVSGASYKLSWLGRVNDTGLGTTYADAEGLAFTSTLGDEIVHTYDGNRLPEWPDDEIERYWSAPEHVGSVPKWAARESDFRA
jgi:hypothetical protein